MYIQVVTVDGKQKTVLTVSKLTKISELKEQIEDEFDIAKEKQALFFSGKHLEDDGTLYDYSVQLNNVIQVMKKIEKLNSPKKINNKKVDKEEEEPGIEAESLYYKVGDKIDCSDNAVGAWFEAVILKIYKKDGELIFKVNWDLDGTKDDEAFYAKENRIRPRAWKVLDFNDLDLNQKVMLNYNLEEPEKIGVWYDFTIKKIKNVKNSKQLIGTIHVGDDTRTVENCTIQGKGDIYEIEKPVLLSERDDELILSRIPKVTRKLPIYCTHCNDNPKRLCRECSCRKCGRKHDPHLTLVCDECSDAFHMACLDPPLQELPPEDEDWYCPDCKVNENEIVKKGEKAKPKKKNSNCIGTGTRDWGKGFACLGRTKECTIVPKNHRGPIPGVDVGTTWKFRLQASEAGVHRPHVAGIHGRSSDCAYSIVLSGGYEDDVDNGDEFYYTGSGGRDLSGNKRTAKQSSDQTLTLMNRALAVNCHAPINDKKGATAVDWRKGVGIRVVRNFKLSKHSKYAPKDGNRYDGIYKVVKYWPEKGQSGYKVWRYLFRRDDPAPAPWTKEGQQRIKELGLEEMIYPEGYQEAQEKKIANGRKRKSDDEEIDSETEAKPEPKKTKVSFKLNSELEKLINKDKENDKLWKLCSESLSKGKQNYLDKVCTEFACVVCQDLVLDPVTTPCAHNICVTCLKRSFSLNTYECPMCRTKLDKDYKIVVNKNLNSILLLMFPGYNVRD